MVSLQAAWVLPLWGVAAHAEEGQDAEQDGEKSGDRADDDKDVGAAIGATRQIDRAAHRHTR